ncbi:hypothetical protein MNAB215_3374 [Mycobacterium numidiamassiliense]|uniref:PPE family protein n=1 Tax=Mycobacterium numidiamassiliense TaxID=1841861 RepID=A0A2U3PBR1_9MYCO|nr:PPE family protein [Mycobacterium numidiamassiliense]SPM41170.1 hypothetical protein MNAB215_3374 [Mycobacterium numidiamassiliense]
MDFGVLPPEVNSGRMYLGPGAETFLAASAGWDALAAELHTAASGYQSVISGLTDDSWAGPSSMSMVAAVMPYLMWMRIAAGHCEHAARNATAAAGAYETAFAAMVPPPLIKANRVRLTTLIATNSLGQHTAEIMATEAAYGEMWAQDAAAMYRYAANSAAASSLSRFDVPPQTIAGHASAGVLTAAHAAAGLSQKTATRVTSTVPQDLRRLSTPGSSGSDAAVGGGHAALADSGALGDMTGLTGLRLDQPVGEGAAAGVGQADTLGTLSVPPSWADALGLVAPEPVLDANVMPGGWGAMRSPTAGRGFAKLPLGGVFGRESVNLLQRIGLRSIVIPRTSVAG